MRNATTLKRQKSQSNLCFLLCRSNIIRFALLFTVIFQCETIRAEVPAWQCINLSNKNSCAQSETLCGWDGSQCLARDIGACWDQCFAAKRPRATCDDACRISMKPFHPKSKSTDPLIAAPLVKAVTGPLSREEQAAITSQITRLQEADFRGDEDFRSLSNAFLKQGRFVAAEALYRQLLQVADYTPRDWVGTASTPSPFWSLPGRMSNRISFMLRVAYPQITRILVAQGRHEEALEYMSRGRSRKLDATIQGRVRGSSSLAGFAGPTLASTRQLATDLDATLIFYSIMSPYEGERDAQPNAIWAWVVQPGGGVFRETLPFQLLHQIDSNDATNAFAQVVMAFHDSLPRGIVDRVMRPERALQANRASRSKRTEYLRTLHQVLIKPLEPYLPKDPDRKIIIVPDGDLFVVPFNALIDEDGKYLVDRHTVSVAPSLNSLALLYEEQKSKRPLSWTQPTSAVVVGDPLMPSFPPRSDFSGRQLTQLDGADREARAIAKLLGVAPLLGANALEDVVSDRMRTARIIHLATHGLMVFESILTIGEVSGSAGVDLPPGAIVLAANPKAKGIPTKSYVLPINGFLTSGKLLMLRLDADLVTLSACDTARGRTDQHQFSGLPNALLASGARTVVMTLWAIPDAPTSELMVAFYKELISGRSKANALRRAILATKERYPDLENWGAFTLIGLPM